MIKSCSITLIFYFFCINTFASNLPLQKLTSNQAIASTDNWFSHQFEVMGTLAKVEFEHSNKAHAQKLLQAVEAEMRRIDELMSPYKESSELSMMNRLAGKKAVQVSDEMMRLLERSFEFSTLTNGAFDVTFSSVGYLYDYRNKQKPSEKQIEQLKSSINYQKVNLDIKHNRVSYADVQVKIDLGGIAKGHAVDQCIKILQQAGIENAYVNAGGDSRIIGRKHSRSWYIGIKHPRNPDKLIANLPLEDVALSTSGDYERYFEKNGVRYHHIIDPKTGDSARAIQSATILANDSTTADALSTSVFVLGVEEGMALINHMPQVSAIIVDSRGKLFLSKDLATAN